MFGNQASPIIHIGMCLIASLTLLCLALPAQRQAIPGNQYTNGDYGYSVLIPENTKIIWSDPLAPNHGFGIHLSDAPPAYLWVDGSFYTEDFAVPQVPQAAIRSLQSRGAANIKLRNKARTQLGGLSAIHFIIDYEMKQTPMVSETIWALRPADAGHSEIHYSINLECARERFQRDSQMVEKLRQGLRLLPR